MNHLFTLNNRDSHEYWKSTFNQQCVGRKLAFYLLQQEEDRSHNVVIALTALIFIIGINLFPEGEVT